MLTTVVHTVPLASGNTILLAAVGVVNPIVVAKVLAALLNTKLLDEAKPCSKIAVLVAVGALRPIVTLGVLVPPIVTAPALPVAVPLSRLTAPEFPALALPDFSEVAAVVVLSALLKAPPPTIVELAVMVVAPVIAPVAAMPALLFVMPPVVVVRPVMLTALLNVAVPVTLIPPVVTVTPVAAVTVPVKLAALEMVWPLIVEPVTTTPAVSTENLLPAVTLRSIRLPVGVPFELIARIRAWPAVGLAEADTASAAFVPEFASESTPAAPAFVLLSARRFPAKEAEEVSLAFLSKNDPAA